MKAGARSALPLAYKVLSSLVKHHPLQHQIFTLFVDKCDRLIIIVGLPFHDPLIKNWVIYHLREKPVIIKSCYWQQGANPCMDQSSLYLI